MQAVDVHTLVLFMGGLNGHHHKWLGTTTTDCHGVADINFAIVSGCDQLVIITMHAHGGTLDRMVTAVPHLVWVAVVAPLGSSDHSSLSIAISMAQAVSNVRVMPGPH